MITSGLELEFKGELWFVVNQMYVVWRWAKYWVWMSGWDLNSKKELDPESNMFVVGSELQSFCIITLAKLWCIFHSSQVKRNLISSIRNLTNELPLELPNNLTFRMLGNREILAKSQNCMGTQPGVQSFLHKWFFGNVAQKALKTDITVFRYCLALFDFLISPKMFCRGL